MYQMRFRHLRDYDPQIVSNVFAVGERIAWGQDSYPGFDRDENEIISIKYVTGIIKKITPLTVIVTIDHPYKDTKDTRLDKRSLAQNVWDGGLRKAIETTIGQNPSKKSDDTPHDAYRLRDPRDNSVFYVGISKNIQRRYKQHLACSGLNFKLNLRIQEILQSGLLPELEIVEKSMPGLTKSKERERFWINHHVAAGYILTNIAEMDGTEEWH